MNLLTTSRWKLERPVRIENKSWSPRELIANHPSNFGRRRSRHLMIQSKQIKTQQSAGKGKQSIGKCPRATHQYNALSIFSYILHIVSSTPSASNEYSISIFGLGKGMHACFVSPWNWTRTFKSWDQHFSFVFVLFMRNVTERHQLKISGTFFLILVILQFVYFFRVIFLFLIGLSPNILMANCVDLG